MHSMRLRPAVIRNIPTALVVALAPALAPAGGPAAFTEESAARGISYSVDVIQTFGCGVCFADLDNDGDPDFVAVGRDGNISESDIGIWENDGTGNFTERSDPSNTPGASEAAGVIAGDFDGDGDLDLFITRWLSEDRLLRNDGNFVFVDVAAAAGVDVDGAGSGAAWGDYDGDTYLDLYVANRTGTNDLQPPFPISMVRNMLFRNLGNGTFTNMAETLAVTDGDAPSFQGAFFDYDRDGDADLYLSNDKGTSTGCAWRNHMWRNDGGTFTDVSTTSQTNGCIDAMCIAFGDFDRNRYLDIFVSNISTGHFLYLNGGAGVFTEAAAAAGVIANQVGWGSVFFDYDNDTNLDLYICHHIVDNYLYVNNGTFPAVNMGPALGVDHTSPGDSFCVAAADIDDDGDIDLAVSNRLAGILLYINHEGETRHWVKFDVAGTGGNKFGVGANVDVRTGSVWQIREVIAGSAFKSQDDLTIHFGLDQATTIDEIFVKWPGGETRTLTNYPADQTWTLYPDALLADDDEDGDVDLGDFAAFVLCFGGPTLGTITPGCERMDFDGDSDVDLGDFAEFALRFTGPL